MSTNRQSRKSPRLVLYGLVFRVLCSVALRAGEGVQEGARAPTGPPFRPPKRVEEGHDARPKARTGLPMNLEPGQ